MIAAGHPGTDNRRGTSSADSRACAVLSAPFNARAGETEEFEIKFLATRNAPTLFGLAVGYFRERGWLRYINDERYLLTRQFDTARMDLARHGGATLRTRATSPAHAPDQIGNSDICIKSGRTPDDSGAIRRAEYQARIADFRQPDLRPLRERYPAAEYPALYDILGLVRADALQEYFRINALHSRCVIELPEEETGLYGARFVAEIACDDCVFLCDGEPGAAIVIRRDQEFECELLFAPDDYDRHPLAAQTHSSPLSADDASRGMAVLKRHILAAAAGLLIPNQVSKAERGQEALTLRTGAPIPCG